jgi:hypothetical protein
MGSRLLVVVEVHVCTMKPYKRSRGIVPLIPKLNLHGGERPCAPWLFYTWRKNSEFLLIAEFIGQHFVDVLCHEYSGSGSNSASLPSISSDVVVLVYSCKENNTMCFLS